jgi:hypothetical protein
MYLGAGGPTTGVPSRQPFFRRLRQEEIAERPSGAVVASANSSSCRNVGFAAQLSVLSLQTGK